MVVGQAVSALREFTSTAKALSVCLRPSDALAVAQHGFRRANDPLPVLS